MRRSRLADTNRKRKRRQTIKAYRPHLERLEDRAMFAADLSLGSEDGPVELMGDQDAPQFEWVWNSPSDIDSDGSITLRDAMSAVHAIRSSLLDPEFVPAESMDVNGDGGFRVDDVLMVIASLRQSLATEDAASLKQGRLTIIGDDGPNKAIVSNDGGLVSVEIIVNGAKQNFDFERSQVSEIVFHGNNGADYFRNETDIPSVAFGGGGNDTLIGGAWEDQIIGGAGNDLVDGGRGIDRVEKDIADVIVNMELYIGDGESEIVQQSVYSIKEDDRLSIPGLNGPLSNSLNVLLEDLPSHGDIVLGNDGAFAYTPHTDFSGNDSFTYVLRNGFAETTPILVSLFIESENDAPTISVMPSRTMSQRNGTLVVAPIIADADGDAAETVIVSNPAHGELQWNQAGVLEYNPNPGFLGQDEFAMRAYDGQAWSDVGRVVVTVVDLPAGLAVEGRRYALSNDRTLWENDDVNWYPITENEVEQFESIDGKVYVLTDQRVVLEYERDKAEWKAITASEIRELATANGSLYTLSGDGIVSELDREEETWDPISDDNIAQLSGFGESLYALDEQGVAREYSGSPLHWVAVTHDDQVKVELDASGELRIKGTEANDDVTVEQHGSQLVVRFSTVAGPWRTQAEDEIALSFSDTVNHVSFQGHAGHDRFENLTSIPSTAVGGDGNDELIGGQSNDTLIGDDGENSGEATGFDDILIGRGGNDTLKGGQGDDWLYGEDGEDVLYGEDGHDNLFGGAENDQLFGDDSLRADSHVGNDRLDGGGGDDMIVGAGGRDVAILPEAGEQHQGVEYHIVKQQSDIDGTVYELHVKPGEPVGELRRNGTTANEIVPNVRDFSRIDGELHLVRADGTNEVHYLHGELAVEMSTYLSTTSLPDGARGIIGHTRSEEELAAFIKEKYVNDKLQVAPRLFLDPVGVVAVRPNIRSRYQMGGTGTVLHWGGNNFVLTADHVIDGFAASSSPGLSKVEFWLDMNRNGDLDQEDQYQVESITRRIGGSDLALLRLGRPVSDVQGALLPELSTNNGEVIAVGYGVSESSSNSSDLQIGVKKFGFTTIDDTRNGPYLLKDPESETPMFRYSGPQLVYRYDPESLEVAITPGDSGGPDLTAINVNGIALPQIVGVHSWGPRNKLADDNDETASVWITEQIANRIRNLTGVRPAPVFVLDKLTEVDDSEPVTHGGAGDWDMHLALNGQGYKLPRINPKDGDYEIPDNNSFRFRLSNAQELRFTFSGVEQDDGIFTGGADILPTWSTPEPIRVPNWKLGLSGGAQWGSHLVTRQLDDSTGRVRQEDRDGAYNLHYWVGIDWLTPDPTGSNAISLDSPSDSVVQSDLRAIVGAVANSAAIDPILATEQRNGDLRLNIGPNAVQRLRGDLNGDMGEHVEISTAGPGRVLVKAYGHEQTYSATRIVGRAGGGNDQIAFASDVAIPVLLWGGDGDDTLVSGGGDDTLRGGNGRDVIDGGSGDDAIHGEGDEDLLLGGVGVDAIYGGAAVDIILAGAHDDFVNGGQGSDFIRGEGGDDQLYGSMTTDDVIDEEDADTIFGGLGQDMLRGGRGMDFLDGEQDSDDVNGEAGADDIIIDLTTSLGGVEDVVAGGLDRDKLWITPAYDHDQGSDAETAARSAFAKLREGDPDAVAELTRSASANDSGHNEIRVTQTRLDEFFVEQYERVGQAAMETGELVGSMSFTMTGGADTDLEIIAIAGLDGNDLIKVSENTTRDLYLDGGEGDDTLIGGAGRDRIFGREGNDTLIGNANNDELHGGKGEDTLQGDAGSDRLYGGENNDKLDGGEGFDVQLGGHGDDEIRAGDGPIGDIIYGDSDDGDAGGGIDTIFGGDGRDAIFGGGGADAIDGGRNIDVIFGGGGDDTILGGAGADFLFGNAGNDIIHSFTDDEELIDELQQMDWNWHEARLDDHHDNMTDEFWLADEEIDAIDILDGNANDSMIHEITEEGIAHAKEILSVAKATIAELEARVRNDPEIGLEHVDRELTQQKIRVMVLDRLDGKVEASTKDARISEGSLPSLIELQNRLAELKPIAADLELAKILAREALGEIPSQYTSVTSDLIDGGTGDDHLHGTVFAERFHGGAGDDTFYHSGSHEDRNDIIVGGTDDDGQDTDTYLLSASPGDVDEVVAITADQGSTSNLYFQVDIFNPITGYQLRTNVDLDQDVERIGVRAFDGDDTMTADFGRNALKEIYFDGGDGDDTINLEHMQAKAEIRGGRGNDTLTGGMSDDLLLGGEGTDVLHGGAGRDTLRGGPGRDSVNGGGENDTIQVVGNEAESDLLISGGEGHDRLENVGSSAMVLNHFRPNFGIDEIVGNGLSISGNEHDNTFNFLGIKLTGVPKVQGDRGNDTMYASTVTGGVRYEGGNGDDTIYGQGQIDIIHGGTGNDTLFGGDSADTIDGGENHDTTSFDKRDQVASVETIQGVLRFLQIGGATLAWQSIGGHVYMSRANEPWRSVKSGVREMLPGQGTAYVLTTNRAVWQWRGSSFGGPISGYDINKMWSFGNSIRVLPDHGIINERRGDGWVETGAIAHRHTSLVKVTAGWFIHANDGAVYSFQQNTNWWKKETGHDVKRLVGNHGTVYVLADNPHNHHVWKFMGGTFSHPISGNDVEEIWWDGAYIKIRTFAGAYDRYDGHSWHH